jgi:hypothetical protein
MKVGERFAQLASNLRFGRSNNPQVDCRTAVRLGLVEQSSKGCDERPNLFLQHRIEEDGTRFTRVRASTKFHSDDATRVRDHCDCIAVL